LPGINLVNILIEAYAIYGYNKNPNISARSGIEKTLKGMRCEQVFFSWKKAYSTVTTMGTSFALHNSALRFVSCDRSTITSGRARGPAGADPSPLWHCET
jgi:hypothetical protein